MSDILPVKYTKEFIMRASMKGVSNECHAADVMVGFLKSKGYSGIKNLHVMIGSPDERKDHYSIIANRK